MRLLQLLAASLAALLLAGPAASGGLAGTGPSYLHPTYCTYESAIAGLDLGDGAWAFVVSLTPRFALCAVEPVRVLLGPWDPAAGGCGPADDAYQLCLDAVPQGASNEVMWILCRVGTPCGKPTVVFSGDLLVARV